VLIARDEPAAALAILEPYGRQMTARGWADERLRALVLQAVAEQALAGNGSADASAAARTLGEALALAEPGGFMRLFLDEGAPMAELLRALSAQGIRSDYVDRLLAAVDDESRPGGTALSPNPWPSPAGPLSPRELEVLQLVAEGLSNQEICERLFLALDTVKGHNRRIFEKLSVQRRTEAVARARELGLL
jgi:LuxR family maltose regulon positive regulatory protein